MINYIFRFKKCGIQLLKSFVFIEVMYDILYKLCRLCNWKNNLSDMLYNLQINSLSLGPYFTLCLATAVASVFVVQNCSHYIHSVLVFFIYMCSLSSQANVCNRWIICAFGISHSWLALVALWPTVVLGISLVCHCCWFRRICLTVQSKVSIMFVRARSIKCSRPRRCDASTN